MSIGGSHTMNVLVFSDIHANKYALDALLKAEKFDEAIFLGDIVDYGPSPGETIDVVRGMAKHIISGNHDYAAAYNVDCLCSQENHELSVFTRENITLKDIGKEEISFLRSLPDQLEVPIDGSTFKLYHGSPADHLYGYLFPWKISAESLKDSMGFSEDKVNYLVGHTHYQFLINYTGNLIVNPGSAGQPRDGNPRPSYALFNSEDGSFKLKRFDYDRTGLRRDLKERIKDRNHLDKLYTLFSL
jgi:protein phosphatase